MFHPESAYAVPLNRADDTADLWVDGPLVPRQSILIPVQGGIDLSRGAAIPAEGQPEEMPAFDACFLDEASMLLVAEETLIPVNGEKEKSPRLRSPGLALLGILASSFWMGPETADATSKRRGPPYGSLGKDALGW